MGGRGGEGEVGGPKNVSAKHRFPPHKLKCLNLIIIITISLKPGACLHTII